MKKLQRAEAEKYWWFRLVKVIYIFFVIFAIIIACISLPYPKTDIDQSHYQTKCNSNGLLFGDTLGTNINQYDENGKLAEKDFTMKNEVFDVISQAVCDRGSIPPEQVLLDLYNDMKVGGGNGDWVQYTTEKTNYTIVLKERVLTETYPEFAKIAGTYLVTLLIIIFGIPKLFSYIVFGKREGEADSKITHI